VYLPIEGKLHEVEDPWRAEIEMKRREYAEKQKTACPCTWGCRGISDFRTPEECKTCQEVIRMFGSLENYRKHRTDEAEKERVALQRELGINCLCECCIENLADNCVLTREPGVTHLFQAAIDPKCKLSTLKELIERYNFNVNKRCRHFSWKRREYEYCSLIKRMRKKCKRRDLLEYVEELATPRL